MARRSKVAQAQAQTEDYLHELLHDENPEERELSFVATDIFFRNQASKAPIVIDRGGRGSSKSHSLAQLMHYKFFTEERKKILILRKSLPSLRQSVYPLMNDLAMEYGVRDRIIEEKVHLNWYYNGSLLHYGSVDDAAKIRSSNWNYVWIEEATEIDYDSFQDIRFCVREPSRDGLRNQIFLSFNPIDEHHWIKTKIVDDPTIHAEEIISNYKDNPFLPEDYVQMLLDLETQDPSLYNIFTLGNWGRLENLIYKNWDIVDWLPDEGAVDKIAYGLDFGYNMPTALIKEYIKGKECWEEQLLYHKNLTNSDLILKLQSLIPKEFRRSRIIWADSAEPDRIEEIRRAGFNAKAAHKIIQVGIDSVKRMVCHIYSGSVDLISEHRSYSWRKDKNGNVLDIPIDWANHLMDAKRYAIHNSTKGAAGVRIRVI